MKRFVLALTLCLAAPFTLFAQGHAAPQIQFRSVPDFLSCRLTCISARFPAWPSIPRGTCSYSRAAIPPVRPIGPAAAELLEFDANGKYIREIGHNLYAWSFAHTVKVDKDDNIWVTDKGSDMVIKFNPEGRVVMVFGRKQEASDEGTGPLKHPRPPLPPVDGMFRQVTDVAWDAAGNTYISDGYINSRVAKVDKDGNWLKSWGEPGKGPGQFNTPHSIAADAQGHVYVADRGNRRIQVFDGDGTFFRQITDQVPVLARRFPPSATNRSGRDRDDRRPARPGRSASRRDPTRFCTARTLFRAASTRLSLDGKVLGCLGSPESNSNSSAGFTKSRARRRTDLCRRI